MKKVKSRKRINITATRRAKHVPEPASRASFGVRSRGVQQPDLNPRPAMPGCLTFCLYYKCPLLNYPPHLCKNGVKFYADGILDG